MARSAARRAPARRASKPPEPVESDEVPSVAGPGDDDEDDDDDEDEDAGVGLRGLTPEQLAELNAMELIEHIGQKGAGHANLRVKFRRIIRPEDENVPGISPGFVGSFPNGKVRAVAPDTLEEDVFGAWGGGSYDLDFFVNARYQRGMSKHIDIAGAARPRALEAAPPAPQGDTNGAAAAPGAATAPGVQPQGVITSADVARLVAEALGVARQQDKMAALEKENAELRAHPRERDGEAPPSVEALVNMVFDRTNQLNKQLSTAAVESPETKMSRERAERAEAKAAELERAAAISEKEENRGRFDRIERLMRRKKKERRSPIAGVTGTLLEVTAADAMLAKLTARVEAGESGGLLDSFLEVVKPELNRIGQELMRNVRRTMEAQARRVEEDQSRGQVPTDGKIDAAAWIKWVQAILQNPGLVEDPKHVREGVRRFGPHVSRLIAINERATLFSFVRETINDETAKAFEAASPEEVARLLKALEVLRGTVVTVAASPPPRAEEHAADAADDDEDDDEDDGKTVEGKRVDA